MEAELPAPAVETSPPRRSRFARWRGPLQILCAVLVLAWVLRLIPWQDVAIHRSPAGETELRGELVGEWKGERATFLPEPSQGPLPQPFDGLPRETSGALELERAVPEAKTGFDWRPGMLRVFREMDPRGLALALSLFAVGQLFVVTRWWRLL